MNAFEGDERRDVTRKTSPVFRGAQQSAASSAAPAMSASGPDSGPAASSPAPVHTPLVEDTLPLTSSPVEPASRKPRTRAAAPANPTAVLGRETRGLRRADALIASGETDKALDHLRKLVRDLPDATRSYLRMAHLLREKRRPGEALEALRAAVQRAPRLAAPREALAEMCLEVGDWEDAIQQSQALLSISPRSLIARDILSAAYLQRGYLSQALRIIDEMIILDPNDASNHFKKGVLLQQQGRVGGAVRAFSRVLEMAPESEAADEARAALDILDNYQMRQIVTLAVENIPFRIALKQNAADTTTQHGYLLSENGLSALSQMRFDDLPAPPPGWRQYHYH
jgi:tetratricopeptide (TPR) repeat protein